MGSQITVIVLRLLHFGGGVFWVGGLTMLSRFVLPSAAAIGPAGGAMMRELAQVRKVPIAMSVAGLTTILSGLLLYGRMEMASSHTFSHSPMGITLAIGGAIAIIAALVAHFVTRPTGMRMVALGNEIGAQGGPPSPAQQAELGALRAKMQSVTKAVVGMLMLTTSLMAIARYV